MNALGQALRHALVAAALLALAACGTQTSGPEAADDVTPTAPTTSASPSESVEPTPTATASTAEPTEPTEPPKIGDLAVHGLPEGAPPQVPYLAADGATWNLVEPDGATRPLPRRYETFAPMGDGLVGTAYRDDETLAFVLDGDLREVAQLNVSGGTLAVTPDGAIVRVARQRRQPARRGGWRRPGVGPPARSGRGLVGGPGQRRHHVQGG